MFFEKKRFNTAYYSTGISADLALPTATLYKPITNQEFQNLAIEAASFQRDGIGLDIYTQFFINKSFYHMFLGNAGSLFGYWHPKDKLVMEYQGTTTLMASMEFMYYLQQLIDDQRLNTESRTFIRKWLVGESYIMAQAAILDRLNNMKILSPAINEAEINLYKTGIGDHIAQMQAGEGFKVFLGRIRHISRLTITLNVDNTFTLCHFDTSGAGKTVIQIDNIPRDKFIKEESWSKLFDLTQTSEDMNPINSFLKSLGEARIVPDELCRERQWTGVCGTSSIKSEFKYGFINQFKDAQEGIEQYKISTSLMSEFAEKTDSKTIEPILQEVFSIRTMKYQLYLGWLQDKNNIPEFESLKQKYLNALQTIAGKYKISINSAQCLEGKSQFEILRRLHKALKHALTEVKKLKIGVHMPDLLAELDLTQEVRNSLSIRDRKRGEIIHQFLMENLQSNQNALGVGLGIVRTYFNSSISNFLFYRGKVAPDQFIDPLLNMTWGITKQEAIQFFKTYVQNPLYDTNSAQRICEFLFREGFIGEAVIIGEKLMSDNVALNASLKLKLIVLLRPEELMPILTSDQVNFESIDEFLEFLEKVNPGLFEQAAPVLLQAGQSKKKIWVEYALLNKPEWKKYLDTMEPSLQDQINNV